MEWVCVVDLCARGGNGGCWVRDGCGWEGPGRGWVYGRGKGREGGSTLVGSGKGVAVDCGLCGRGDGVLVGRWW